MTTPLAYLQEKGDPVEILARDYYFERVDPDHAVTYRAPYGASYPDFMVDDDNGHPRKPTTAEMNAIFAQDGIIFRSKPSSNESRRLARNMELDAEQCRTMDAKSPLRVAISLFCDDNCGSLSDDAMFPVIRRAIAQPEIIALNPTGWVPHPTTVREWMRERGEPGRRKPRDGVSMAGRYLRSIVSRHPVELILYHIMSACLANDQNQIQSFYDCYVADLWKVNNGKPLDRPMLIEGEDGAWSVGDEAAEYPRPSTPYKAVHYTTFWRRVRDMRTPKLFGLATTEICAPRRLRAPPCCAPSGTPTRSRRFPLICSRNSRTCLSSDSVPTASRSTIPQARTPVISRTRARKPTSRSTSPGRSIPLTRRSSKEPSGQCSRCCSRSCRATITTSS
jgi:hypothetical protein